jgi:hypothetical protein
MAHRLDSPTTLYASAARTANPTAHEPYRLTGKARGILVQIDCTSITSTPSVVFTVQNMSSDAWATALASAAVTAAGTTNLVVHPSAADRANVSENTQLTDVWRVIATHGDTDSITYSVKVWPLR